MAISRPTKLSLFALEVLAFFGVISHLVLLSSNKANAPMMYRVSFSLTEVLDAFMSVGLLVVLRSLRLGHI
jgi:hypothetical protein